MVVSPHKVGEEPLAEWIPMSARSGVALGESGCCCCCCGCYLGRSWGHLGAISNLPGNILGDLGAILGLFRTFLGLFWAILGHLGAISNPPGAIWGNLGAFCRQVMKKLVSCVDVARLLLKTLIFPCVFDVEVGFVR